MAIVKPFRAVRPKNDKVSAVVSLSYEAYEPQELEGILKNNPFSFLNIIKPSFENNSKISRKKRFQKVRNQYGEFIKKDILIQDNSPCFYLYKVMKNEAFALGVFCATSVHDYQKNVIKKHEATLEKREKLFANYLKAVGYNAEPVLMTYPDTKEINELFIDESNKPAKYEFTTSDGVVHKVWCISDAKKIRKITYEFSKVPSIYIADGHHRSASSSLLAETLKKTETHHTGKENYNFFMSYLIPESQVKIYQFTRMVKDLNNLALEEFLKHLNTFYHIQKKDDVFTPVEKHNFSMYLAGDFYSLQLRKEAYHFKDALSELDTQILYKTILEPILGISDLRNDKRISYGHGKFNLMTMKNRIDTGQFAVGFSMLPITIDEIKAIADAGLVMPPKSTYIQPKLRSGLTIYEL